MLPWSRPRLVGLALASLLAHGATACSDDSFHVERAPTFPKAAGAAISVFGVFRDGRLAPEAWDSLRSHTAPVFGTAPCEPGYPDILTSSGTPALQAVDDFSRANGVTDELMDRLAPMAKGDLILLITLTGRPASKSAGSADDTSSPMQASAPGVRGSNRGRGTPSGSGPRKAAVEANAFEAVGIVFSPKAHKSVEAIRMTYTGTSLDDALQSFMERVGQELPQATCGGWKLDGHVDAADIHRLESE